MMNEPDYCERCDLYTMQKQEPEPDETEDVWYCPVCDQFEVRVNSAIVSNSEQEGYNDQKNKD